LAKHTVLGDLEGLLTVDVAHLCVGTGCEEGDEVVGFVGEVDEGCYYLCEGPRKNVDFAAPD
jgi:hypothetical protein